MTLNVPTQNPMDDDVSTIMDSVAPSRADIPPSSLAHRSTDEPKERPWPTVEKDEYEEYYSSIGGQQNDRGDEINDYESRDRRHTGSQKHRAKSRHSHDEGEYNSRSFRTRSSRESTGSSRDNYRPDKQQRQKRHPNQVSNNALSQKERMVQRLREKEARKKREEEEWEERDMEYT